MHPRGTLRSALAAVCAGLIGLLAPVTAHAADESFTVFAGGFGAGGVVRVSVAPAAKETAVARVASMASPTFLLRHPTLPLLYISSELSGGKRNIRVLRPTGETVASAWSGGSNPVRLALNAAGDRLAVANYDGSVALLAVDAAGVPGAPLTIARTSGSGPDPKRQSSSHPHSVVFSPSGGSVYVADLGADTVIRYDLGPTRSSLTVAQRLALPPGSGPRQVVVDGSFAYVPNELSRSITTLRLGSDGGLSVVGTIALPKPGAPGELLVDPTGRWVIVLVRGVDECQVLEVLDGGLRPGQAVPCGRSPRFAQLTTAGDRLVIATQRDGTIRVAPFDPATGTLGPATAVALLPGAAGLALLP